MSNRAVILLSGGLDSTTCLALAKNQGFDCYALSFDYGQKHNAELAAAKNICAKMGVIEHQVCTLDTALFTSSALTNKNIDIPDYDGSGDIPPTYVPARNTIFLSYALAWAEVLEAYDIFIGVSHVDYSGYPDCRPEYIEAFQTMANFATETAVKGQQTIIHSPIINLSKAETIKVGLANGVDYSITVSCYRVNANGEACGTCNSCVLRKRGFEQAGAPDVTHYAEEITPA